MGGFAGLVGMQNVPMPTAITSSNDQDVEKKSECERAITYFLCTIHGICIKSELGLGRFL